MSQKEPNKGHELSKELKVTDNNRGMKMYDPDKPHRAYIISDKNIVDIRNKC